MVSGHRSLVIRKKRTPEKMDFSGSGSLSLSGSFFEGFAFYRWRCQGSARGTAVVVVIEDFRGLSAKDDPDADPDADEVPARPINVKIR